MGDRLAHSNGIIFLALVAAALLVAFQGNIERLIALYALGVFLAFTLSQTGMVVHWLRRRGPRWRRGLLINAFGAGLSGVVLIVIAVAKFSEGAWSVLLLVPLVVITMLRIRRHYDHVDAATALRPPDPVSWVDLPNLRSLAYAASLDQPVLAIFVGFDDQEDARMREYWRAWGDHIPLETIISPYRVITLPLVHYVREMRALRPDLTLTVVIPKVVVRHWWQRPLHNDIERPLHSSLVQVPGVIVASVPFHLPGR
jgi:hypothetical protein